MFPSPRLASLSALPKGNGDAMSNVSSNADDAAPANAVLSGCVDACVGNAHDHSVLGPHELPERCCLHTACRQTSACRSEWVHDSLIRLGHQRYWT